MTGDIHPLLTRLGATADDVAAALGAAGVRARRGHATYHNPVVRYVNRTLDLGARLEVHGATLAVHRGGTWIAIPLPPPVQDFLGRFDAGAYPHLELP